MPEPSQSVQPAQDNIPITQPKPAEEPKDIVERVSKAKAEPEPEKTEIKLDDVGFNRNDIEKIQDPQARQYAEQAYKELESGFNKKYQKVAELRKQLETEKEALSKPRQWTAQELQQELKNPSLVQAAQYLNSQQLAQNQSGGDLTDEEWSTLTPQERQNMVALQQQQQQFPGVQSRK